MTISELKVRLEKSINFLESELAQIRTNRANPSLVEGIEVIAYGTHMKVKELGAVTVIDAQNLAISPWDKGLLNVIANAIRESDLKLNPVVGGDSLRIPLPALTEDRRKEIVRVVSAKVEDCKNALRNTRQEAMKDVDKDFTAKVLSEDEKFAAKEEIERIVKEFGVQTDELGETKKKDVMTV